MKFGKGRLLWKFKWHIVVIYLVLIALVLLAIFTDIFQELDATSIPPVIWLLGALVLLLTLQVTLSKISKISDGFAKHTSMLEKIAEILEKNRSVLTQIDQSSRLSETAKIIAFRDADRQSLREAVFDKLQQQDFDTAYKIIDEIASRGQYPELIEQLRTDADNYRDATDTERFNQTVSHIEKLFENYQWAKASILIERLIKTYPQNEDAKALRQKLIDKKEERKKILLTAWDDAVKRQATDRSLEILHELDLYLSPNEGLALQEAARDVFKTKLHNLGVQFSIAVSGQQWNHALEIGQQIVRGFPNSKMAAEIREKWDILKQKAEQLQK